METILPALQVILALGLLNVWLRRASRATPYRGGAAVNMREEFNAYGLPSGSHYVIGALKVSAALALIAGFWFPVTIFPAAVLIFFLMVGAVTMHVKIHDPFKKLVPALLMLGMSACVIALVR